MRLLERGAAAQDVEGDGAALVYHAATDYAVAKSLLENDDGQCCRKAKTLPCKCVWCPRHGFAIMDGVIHAEFRHLLVVSGPGLRTGEGARRPTTK